ncbi:MAG: hypothetical protein JW923_09005 [Spirochaetales bacterium]|nr:hypothetical protein [Spirochaetales bacterium]MBN2875986.1 hypothetical protein [Spirochaetales bacterium]
MGLPSQGIFATLPQSFFSPLASPNRVHYAALLGIYYRLFQESPHGIVRKTLLERFSDYIDQHWNQFEAEEGLADGGDGTADVEAFSADDAATANPSRNLAARIIRTFVATSWMSEEVLPDYTRIINMCTHARPFLEVLARIEEGLKVEYESHVVAVYSLLCGDAARENGHYVVLNAHSQTMALIDSLKVLSQSIREHYERLTEKTEGMDVAGILALHYGSYATDILDGAYKRLKTSDNLSRYRPRILSQVRDFLLDQAWLDACSLKYARTASVAVSESRQRLVAMLEEIRDTLKAVDPLLEEIDRRNMLYARSSVERMKALLEPASTIAGRIARAARLIRERPHVFRELPHHLYKIHALSPDSRYRRWLRETIDVQYEAPPPADTAEFDRIEQEFRLRLERQLSPARIAQWLDEKGGRRGPLSAPELAATTEDFVRLVYAILFADSRPESFPYCLEERGSDLARAASGWLVPDVSLRRRS